jgi:hypothetical protein
VDFVGNLMFNVFHFKKRYFREVLDDHLWGL